MDTSEQTVEKYLFSQCSESLLLELVGNEPESKNYWKNVDDFVEKNRDKKLNELTAKQRGWLINIKQDLFDAASREWD